MALSGGKSLLSRTKFIGSAESFGHRWWRWDRTVSARHILAKDRGWRGKFRL